MALNNSWGAAARDVMVQKTTKPGEESWDAAGSAEGQGEGASCEGTYLQGDDVLPGKGLIG